MKAIILIFSFLIMNQAQATKPTIAKRTKKQRAKIEKLRYQPSDKDITKKLLQNLKRDCVGFSYHSKDRDLMVIPTYRTYPQEKRWLVVKKSFLNICPANLSQVFMVEKDKSSELAAMSRRYLRNYKGDQYWPYTQAPVVKYFAKLMSQSCQKGDAVALKSILCKFKSQSPEDNYIEIIKNEFQNKCSSHNINLECKK